MGFVKTASEIERIKSVVTAPRFRGGRAVTVVSSVDRDWVAEVVPPGLIVGPSPTAVLAVNDFAAAPCGPFAGGSIRLSGVRTEDGVEGTYVLAQIMSTGSSVTYGRELLGEPKRVGAVELTVSGDAVRGSVERHGTRLLDISLDGLQPVEAVARPRVDANVSWSLDPADGSLAADAQLVLSTSTPIRVESAFAGQATVRLGGTPDDPWSDVPLGALVAATFQTGVEVDVRWHSSRPVDAVDLEPYAFGRTPDWGLAALQGDA